MSKLIRRPSLASLYASRPGWAALAGCLVTLWLGGTAQALADTSLDAIWAAERQDALTNLQSSAREAQQLKLAAAAAATTGEVAVAAIKAELAGLQKQLLSEMAKDDPGALRVSRAWLSVRQTALDAEEGLLTLTQKKTEEAERDRDAWKKRADSLELAQRMDMKAMLAGPAEVADREKRVEVAEKEIATQEAQIRKYAARRAAVAARREILSRRLAALAAADNAGLSADLRRAQEEDARQIRRLIATQEAWFRLNRTLELRARRNLAFARADGLVSRRFAEALARKADIQRANDLQNAADRHEAQSTLLRTTLSPLQQALVTNLTSSLGAADAALKTIGEAHTAQEEEHAHAAYAQIQTQRARWEAESECWKELLALQKAATAFVHEQADRARSRAEDRSIADINQDEQMLRGSLVTSEQYVRNLELQLQKTDIQIESARRELGLRPQQVTDLASPLADLLSAYDAARPPSPALVADLLQSLAQQVPEGETTTHLPPERRHEIGASLVARLAQRALLSERKGVSERWLEHSRTAIQTLEQLAGHQLWLPHDPRLNPTACQETLSVAGAILDSAWFTLECWSHRISGLSDVPRRTQVLLGLGLVLLLGCAGWLGARRLAAGAQALPLTRHLIATLPPLTAGAALAAWASHGVNLALLGLAWLLLALTVRVLLRTLLLACTHQHRAPARTSVGGAAFAAINSMLLWSVVLLPFHQVAGHAVNAWGPQVVLVRLWLFGVCLALFRLVMHPAFAGRLLSRQSRNPGLRWLGNAAAIACVLVAALVTITYLAGLDNLGRSVLHTAEGTFATLASALVIAAILGRVTHRAAAGNGWILAGVRLAQMMVLAAAAGTMAWIWWWLLNRAVLANNAPSPVPEIVQVVKHGLHALVRLWQAQLATGVTVASLTRGLAVIAASFWAAKHIKSLLLQRVLSRTPMDEATQQTFVSMSGWIVILLGFLVGMNVAGSSLQNLALLAGAITVGVGFGLQNVINNFVSSLLIHFGRTIRVGDYIDVGGTRGTVREIGMRNTVLVTDDEITVLVPNGSFITANIVNWTNPSRRTRLHVPVVVLRQADLTAVAELAVAAASSHALVVKTPAPVLEVRSVTAAQVTLDLLIWSERPEKTGSIVGDISLALDRALRERGFAV